MVEQLCAYTIVLWLCPVGPLVLVALGVHIGRHGFQHTLTKILVKIFGTAREGFDQG